MRILQLITIFVFFVKGSLVFAQSCKILEKDLNSHGFAESISKPHSGVVSSESDFSSEYDEMVKAAKIFVAKKKEYNSAANGCPQGTEYDFSRKVCWSEGEKEQLKKLDIEIDQRNKFAINTFEMRLRTEELMKERDKLLMSAKERVGNFVDKSRGHIENFRSQSQAGLDYRSSLRAYLNKSHHVFSFDAASDPERLLSEVEAQQVPTKIVRFKSSKSNPSLEKMGQALKEKQKQYDNSGYKKYMQIATTLAVAKQPGSWLQKTLKNSELKSLERELKKLEKGFLSNKETDSSLGAESKILEELKSIYEKTETQAEVRYVGSKVQSYEFYSEVEGDPKKMQSSLKITLSDCTPVSYADRYFHVSELSPDSNLCDNTSSWSLGYDKLIDQICERYIRINKPSKAPKTERKAGS